MGIKNLIKLIDRYSPNAIKYTKITNYKNTVLGVDANLMIYKMVYAIRKNGYDLRKSTNTVTHIHTMLQKLYGFRKYGIQPIFVFDSGFPEIKSQTMKTRNEFQKMMKIKYNKAETEDERKKYYFMKSDITQSEIDECKILIDIFGYQIIDSVEEADTELSNLSKRGLIEAIITDDMDILVFGGKIILKNFTVSDKKKIQQIDLDTVLNTLDISLSQFVDISVMLGCDYCFGAKGVGPIKGYELIKKYKSLQYLMDNKIIANIDNVDKALKYFKHPPKKTMGKIDKIDKVKKFNEDRFIDFLEKKGYTLMEINVLLKKLVPIIV